MTRTRLTLIVLFALAVAACDSHTTTGGGVSILQPSIVLPAIEQFHAYPSSSWQPAPGGAAENPATAPNECDCPAGFSALYNGHNWVCTRGTDRYFPTKDAFCNVQR